MEFKDYYKTLGVKEDAPADEIRRAYRRLARKYHPDLNKEASSEDKFKELGEAYEVLKDPEKRKSYDQVRKGGWRQGEEFRPPPGWQSAGGRRQSAESFQDASGFSDFFENLFGGGGFRERGRSRAAPGQDVHARIEIDLEDAYTGARRRINLEGSEVDAEGHVRRRTRQLDVNIPAGVREGQQIRLAGQGEPGFNGGPAGDLFLEVGIRPHRRFELQGRDIHLGLPIAPWEAALGTTIKVPTLGGAVSLTIPPGSDSGQRLRLKGRGLPGKPPGDQYVTLKVMVPKARSDRERELYEELGRVQAFDARRGLEDGS